MSPVEIAATPDPGRRPDRVVREIAFWGLLALVGFVVLGAHQVERQRRYVLADVDAAGKPIVRSMPHGSYGASLPKPNDDPRLADLHRIVLLGNSVYQSCGIVERMQRRANERGDGIGFVNLSMTGAGIHDHFALMLRGLQHRPELVVVAFVNLAFTADWVGNQLPRFRTDADQFLFDADVIGQVPWSFLRREFTPLSAGASLASSLLPLKRLDVLLRIEVDTWLYWRFVEAGIDPVVFRQYFRLPTLNLAQDWVDLRGYDLSATAAQPYPEAAAVVREFCAVCARNDVPVLFLRQESSAVVQPDILPTIAPAIASFPRARLVDLQPAFDAQAYVDTIHPREQARDDYAGRHYDAITTTWRELGGPRSRGAK